ncbi:MAG: STAS domain-containing protein [Treponema sp.]|nr:STAS domain-containing protein [Treponema sp.]
MTITSERVDKSTVELLVEGRLDTASAPQLERKIRQWTDGKTDLILDFSRLTYISSMGLRVLLQTQKAMNGKDRKLEIRHLAEAVREVFEMTGFINLLVQEEKLVVIRKDEANAIVLALLGQMNVTTIPILEQELAQIQESRQMLEETTEVILDMEKLTALSASGCRILSQSLTDTAWDKRKISLRNAESSAVRDTLLAEGLGGLLEARE